VSSGPARIGQGLLTDASRALGFRFDGRALCGLAGDTLASALLANGIRLVGRSFKYHRPRGVVTAGPQEPCALVDVIGPSGREPNCLATTLSLTEGLTAESQNHWPSLRFDLMAVNGLFGRFLPAGFYYKTFMAPAWAWEPVYEPFIRRAAGLGRLEPKVPDHSPPAETVHQHADVLVVGAGPAGLAAARVLARAGLRVLIAQQDVVAGGGALIDARWDSWRERTLAELSHRPGVSLLTRTTVIGGYGHGVFGALETLTSEASQRCGGLRERLHVIRAQRVVLAAGAIERLIAFPGNDRPGVMLAGAAHSYLRRYGVAVGQRPAVFLNNDEAYASVHALLAAGIGTAVIDVRADSPAAERARAQGAELHTGAVIQAVAGGGGVRSVRIAPALQGRAGGRPREIRADSVLMSGGYTPAASLATQLGAELEWHEPIAAFVPRLSPQVGCVVGAARGVFGLAAAARDAERAAREMVASLGRTRAREPGQDRATDTDAAEDLPADAQAAPLAALWEVRGRGKAFVDLQNDVTTEDVRLAQREGYEHVEHMKRFTTHGMATDQGGIGGLVGSAVLAAARGLSVAQVGQSRPRPYAEPIAFAALAGPEVRQHFKPTRRLPLHGWHAGAGATFVATGLWLRPLVYSRASGWEPVLEEARAVRRAVGITDVSTLGKIDVQGADAARFLDFIYANTFSTLAVGRARYGIMLREDGLLLDDGTTARLGSEHFLVTTTTANAAAVLEHLEFQLQAHAPHMDVVLTDVGEQWAQFALAGPRSREVLGQVVEGIDLSNAAFPFMAACEARIAGIPGRLFRISFSGELAYEIAVPAREALTAWSALIEAGRGAGIRPYGLDALNTLRIEKGHVTGAELNGNTTAQDLGFGRMLKPGGDFVGRVLSQRPALAAADRLQLVGVRPRARTERLRNGYHLVAPQAPATSLGYITSSTPSVEADGWLGLALLAGGRARIGQQLRCSSPVHGEQVDVEIVSPHFLDPENARVRS